MINLKIKCLAHLPELTISPDKSAKANELTPSRSSEIQIFALESRPLSWAVQTLSAANRTKEWRAWKVFLKLAAALKETGSQQILTASSDLH